ncbi:MAG: sigma-70 family RNA polymerase sigma factor [Acidobacteriota bacterium]|nr:sigma-70 family RNA polymerase sigma factor [Acidobacteriota bacterium]
MKAVTQPFTPGEDRTDEELVGLVLADHREVFARLYERYYSRTYRLAYAMTGRREAAEDLTQEVFIRAYQRLGQFRGQSSFSTWFYRLTVNHCVNYRRHERRTQGRELYAAGDYRPHGVGGRAEADFFQQQVQGQIHRALLSLKPELRMVVILKDVEGLRYEEIAERMNCSAGTVGTWLNRARKLLARKLEHLKGPSYEF